MNSTLRVLTSFEFRNCLTAYLTSNNQLFCRKTQNLSEVFRSFSIHAVNCQRGNMSKKSFFYAVRAGRKPGVYSTWDECLAQVSGFSKASYKKFPTYEAAEVYANNKVPLGASTTKSNTDNVDAAATVVPPTCFDVRLMPMELQPEPVHKTGNRKRKRKLSGEKMSSNVPCVENGEKREIYDRLTSHLISKVDDLQREVAELRGQAKPNSSGPHPSEETPCKNLCIENLEIPKTMIHVYTDGACTKNGFSGAKAGIGVYWGPDHPFNVSERLPGRQTNNRAEIQAAVKALEQAKMVGIKELTLYTDSNFLINGVTKWVKNWKRNGWKLRNGQPVINRIDFEDLEKARVGLSVKWVHVRGHQGIAGNEAADHLAVQGMSKELSPSR